MPFETLHVGTKPRMSHHQLPGGGKDEAMAVIIQTNTGMVSQSKKSACGIHNGKINIKNTLRQSLNSSRYSKWTMP